MVLVKNGLPLYLKPYMFSSPHVYIRNQISLLSPLFETMFIGHPVSPIHILCLSACVYQISVKTAEPIAHNFCVDLI